VLILALDDAERRRRIIVARALLHVAVAGLVAVERRRDLAGAQVIQLLPCGETIPMLTHDRLLPPRGWSSSSDCPLARPAHRRRARFFVIRPQHDHEPVDSGEIPAGHYGASISGAFGPQQSHPNRARLAKSSILGSVG
jgi:hypothetical protein